MNPGSSRKDRMSKARCHTALILLFTLVLFSFSAVKPSTQKASKLEIEQWRDVLRNVKRALKENYYDPTFHGIDIEARFKLAVEKMKSAESLGRPCSIDSTQLSKRTTLERSQLGRIM